MAVAAVADLTAALAEYPVIAAVRDLEQDLPAALGARVRVVFLLGGSILDVARAGAAARSAGKLLFLHLDLMGGLGRDDAALEWLARAAAPAGLITTRSQPVGAMRRLGLVPVQRIFLLDSQSLATGLEAVRHSRAEVVEVLPGIVPKAIRAVAARLQGPALIAGGLVRSPREVALALAAGANGVSTSARALWDADPDQLRIPKELSP